MFKKLRKNEKGFTLAELLIVVAIIGVLVAISIPIFTSQLEKAREATDLANIRSAYAELTAEYLTNGSDSTTTTLPKAKTVKVTQKQDNWQSVGDGKSATATIADNVSVTSATSGNYKVQIDKDGKVTVTTGE